MRDVSAVRGLQSDLEAANIDVLLLNIHDAPGSLLLERFAFRATPTYLLFDRQGVELWRAGQLPSMSRLRELLTG